MNLTVVALVGIIVLLVVLCLGMSIGPAMFLIGVVGYAVVVNPNAAFGLFKTVPFENATNYAFTVIPLFILMGQFAFHAGLSSNIFAMGEKWLGRFKGGLAMATVAGCAGFSCICGSTAATAATMGVIALPEMRKYGFADGLSTGAIAAGGTLGMIIPPSTGFIVFGIVSQQSIGRLFAAGILPGILLAVCYILAVSITVKVKPDLAPGTTKYPLKEMIVSLRSCIPMAILFLAVVGGMFASIFTANEAAAVGASLTFLFMVAKRKFTWTAFIICLRDTLRTASMIFLILIGACVFGSFLAITKLPMTLAAVVNGLNVNPYIILAIIVVFYIILGAILDGMAMIMLTVPIFMPVMINLGFDPIWYGVLMILVVEASLITPPVGMNVYIVAGIAKDVSLFTIFKGVMPFVIALFFAIFIVICFPALSLYLPNLFYGA